MVTTKLRGSKLIRIGFLGLLLVILIGLLGVYATIGTIIPIGSSYGREPYARNGVMLESIAQLSPILNYMSEEDGVFVAGVISWRTSRVRASLSVQQDELEETNAVPYDLDFHGEYQLTLPDSRLNTVEVIFPFPQNLKTLHDVQFLVDGEEPKNVEYGTGGIRWQDEFISNEEHTITIRYRAEGAYTFTYELPKEQRTDIDVEITVDGITGASIPDSSLPPMEIENGNNSETISWDYSNLIDNRNIQIHLPIEPSFSQQLALVQTQLHDFAAAAPVIVGTTLLALLGMFHMSGLRLKIENYLLLGCALVFFFPMVTFLSGLIGIFAGSIISLAITIGVITLFLRQTVGWRQIGWSTMVVLTIFLGAFALGRITELRGLLLTAGGVVLLGIFMLRYARWQKIQETLETAQPLQEIPDEAAVQALEGESEAAPISLPADREPSDQGIFHCPQCAHELEDDNNFCPNCGYESKQIRHCDHCGHEQLPPVDLSPSYCLNCGEELD